MTAKKPSMKQAILAKCHDCMGHYADGKVECWNQRCSLYFWMPYASLNPDREWELYSPKKMGLQLKSNIARTMTDEQKKACADRFALARQKKSDVVSEDLVGTDTEDDEEDDEDEEE